MVAAPTGTKDHPSGCCRNCSSLTCEHHGTRDGAVPEFICVECDPLLAVASATAVAESAGGEGITEDLVTTAAGYRPYTHREPLRWVARSAREFAERRPQYGEDLGSFFGSTFHWRESGEPDPRSLAAALEALPPAAAELLALAAYLSARFELAWSGRLDPRLADLARSLEWRRDDRRPPR